MKKRTLCSLVVGLALVITFQPANVVAQDQILYRQVFGNNSDPLVYRNASAVNWIIYAGEFATPQTAGNYGQAVTPFQSASVTADNDVPEFAGNINSLVVAEKPEFGFARVFRDDDGPSFFMPDESEAATFGPIDPSLSGLTFAWWFWGNHSTPYRLALQINGAWIVSDEVFVSPTNNNNRESATYFEFNFINTPQAWRKLDFSEGLQVVYSEQNLANENLEFPEGPITNFGFLIAPGAKTGTNFDSIVIRAD